jgi:hypothetical protein
MALATSDSGRGLNVDSYCRTTSVVVGARCGGPVGSVALHRAAREKEGQAEREAFGETLEIP